MIKICYIPTKSIKVVDHADNKLVCCAVSTIMYTIPAWFHQNEIEFKVDEKTTTIKINLLEANNETISLLNLAYLQLQVLADSYPKDIKLTVDESNYKPSKKQDNRSVKN